MRFEEDQGAIFLLIASLGLSFVFIVGVLHALLPAASWLH